MAAKKALPKSQVIGQIAEKTGLARKQVSGAFEALGDLIKRELKKGPGVFTVPGLMKLTLVRKPATKAREGINPFTKQPIMIKAKPARNVVRIRPLKNLKEMVK